MSHRTLDDLDLKAKRVLVRVDLNVPVKDGRVTDDTRIRASLPTIREIMDKGGRPILLAHFGRPKGKREAGMSLKVVVPALEAALGVPVRFAEDCIGEAAERAARDLPEREVLLLENTRFHAGEEADDPGFADALARLGEAYVNDAFSAAHRAHASTEGLAHRLPAAAGRLMEAEIHALERALERPERPLVAVVGGAKVSTKIELLANLTGKCDQLIIGGGMANTFLAAQGAEIGRSLAEPDLSGTRHAGRGAHRRRADPGRPAGHGGRRRRHGCGAECSRRSR
jgi:phosphoglycerate kinase